MNMLQKRVNQRGQGGFTLIELLVVIAILAILAGVVVFAVGNTTDSAKTTACKAEAKTLSVAANATKASRLTNASGSIGDFLDATLVSGVYTGTYFVATETANTSVAFTPTAAGTAEIAKGCVQPKNVTYS